MKPLMCKKLGAFVYSIIIFKVGNFPIKGDHLSRIKKVSKDQTLEPSSEIFLDLSRRIFPYNEAEYGSIKDSPLQYSAHLNITISAHPSATIIRAYTNAEHIAYCAQKTLIKSRS